MREEKEKLTTTAHKVRRIFLVAEQSVSSKSNCARLRAIAEFKKS